MSGLASAAIGAVCEMAANSGLYVGTQWFKTKARAEEFIRALLNRHANGQELKGADLEFALLIVKAHPNRNAIEQCGIKSIFVQWLDGAGNQRRFVCVRTDESKRDFTWRHLIHPRSALDRVRRVCRWLIRDQVECARELAFKDHDSIACPVSGLPITRDTSDIDHVSPATFKKLVDDWLLCNIMTADDIEIIPSPHYQEPDRFEDSFLAENWKEFHEINAVLRAVHPIANRSILRKGRAA